MANVKISRWQVWTAIIVVILALSLYAYRTVNLNIKEGVRLDMKPEYSGRTLQYAESENIPISVDINNYWLCKTYCSFEFIDLTNNVSEKGNITVQNYKRIDYDAKISANIKGTGQKIYQYKIECSNKITSICPSGEEKYRRTSTIILDYGPNEAQRDIISKARQKFKDISADLAVSELNILNASNIIAVSDARLDDVSIDNEQSLAKSLKMHAERAETSWRDNNFEESYDIITDISGKSSILRESASYKLSRISDIIDTHNKIILLQKTDMSRAEMLKNLTEYYPYSDIKIFGSFRTDVLTALQIININTDSVNALDNYSKILTEQTYQSMMLEELYENLWNASKSSFSLYLDLLLAEQMTCENCTISDSREIVMQNSSDLSKAFLHDEYLLSLKNRCEMSYMILPQFESTRIANLQRRSTLDNTSLPIVDAQERRELLKHLFAYKDKEPRYADRIKTYIEELNYSSQELQDNNTNIDPALRRYYSLSEDLMLRALQEIRQSCNRNLLLPELVHINRSIQHIPQLEYLPKSLTLPAIRESCCIGESCRRCCDDCINPPLILLHGHSLVSENSPYKSTEIFNSIEESLEADGYISLGTISPTAWARIRHDKKIIIKPTYYVSMRPDTLGINITASKDESIDTYARRLKDHIDFIKSLTGQSRVDIVAHSMGGLVTRRYVQLYGNESIRKFIMIGTPNGGIDDKTTTLCKLFGEDKECEDMKKGSAFLEELDKIENYPETYIIAGKGCAVGNEESDGVVELNSALLENIQKNDVFYIQGKCSAVEKLHNTMLDMDKHQETYQIIKRII